MSTAPRVAALTRTLGRLSGIDAWARPLRPLRTVAWRLLRKRYPPERMGSYAGVVAPLRDGLVMRLDPRSLIEWDVLFAGYEPELRELLRRALRPGDAAIDAGANAGAHSLVMAQACAPGAVVSCEPNPELFQRLEDNIRLNGLGNVRARQVALGAEAGRLELLVPADPVHTGGASVVPEAHEHLRDARRVEVDAVTVDVLAGSEGLERVALLKVDVEGYEAAVLAGARGVIVRDRPAIAIEYTEDWWRRAGASLDEVVGELAGLGYRPRMVTWRGLRPIPSPAPPRMNLWLSPGS